MSETSETRLSFVPTPIGNLKDITMRAIECLKESDYIACEDTRHSSILLKNYDIRTKMVSLNEQNEKKRIPQIIQDLENGKRITVISDAGTPCICDPGYPLLIACREKGIPFTVLPGASAITTALLLSGFPPYPFFFGGFLPIKKNKRSKVLEDAGTSRETSIFYESPHRILSTLEILLQEHPSLEICICREITKKFETIYRGTAEEIFSVFSEKKKIKGEIVLLLNPKRR